MDENFYKELQQMSRDNDMRAKVMILELKKILKDKKEENVVKKLKRNKPKTKPHWN